MKKKITWYMINISMAILLYFALFNNIIWCQNLLKFIIWINFILHIIITCLIDDIPSTIETIKKDIPTKINLIYSLIFIGILASFGWFGYAGMELIAFICQQGIKQQNK